MHNYRLMATTAFGVEGITKKEVKYLGFKNIEVENGKVYFDADQRGIAKANLWLRTASKVYWIVDTFYAKEFDELYESVKKIPWEDILNKSSEFPVYANSVKSTLYSESSIQSICKKAIVDRLKETYNVEWFEEDGNRYEIQILIRKDRVLVGINTTGESLHRRGYRTDKNEAPLRENLAATLVRITNWKAKIPLIDPMCGTGTILIEAALYGKNIAPGLKRNFAFENWPFIDEGKVAEERVEARNKIVDRELNIKGYDVDPDVIEMARENAKRAGVEDAITFKVRDLKRLNSDDTYGYLITNPPYGERLGTYSEAKKINELIGEKFKQFKTWSKYILTSFDGFEEIYGEEATKNRKLYNGKIKCYFYQYYGPRPPKDRL